MDVGKVEKFDLSKIKVHTKNSPFRLKLLNLEVGQGFVVTGIERTAVQSPITTEHQTTNKRFVITKLEMLKYQVVRVK